METIQKGQAHPPNRFCLAARRLQLRDHGTADHLQLHRWTSEATFSTGFVLRNRGSVSSYAPGGETTTFLSKNLGEEATPPTYLNQKIRKRSDLNEIILLI